MSITWIGRLGVAGLVVTLLVVARPYLFACQGNAEKQVRALPHVALFDRKGSQREEYLRVRETNGGLELFPNQSSGVLYSTSWGHGLVRQGLGEDIGSGATVDYLPFASFN